jgi:hypothetical protein
MEKDNQIEIEDLLKHMRDQIGTQAQEIAVLRATINAMSNNKSDKVK